GALTELPPRVPDEDLVQCLPDGRRNVDNEHALGRIAGETPVQPSPRLAVHALDGDQGEFERRHCLGERNSLFEGVAIDLTRHCVSLLLQASDGLGRYWIPTQRRREVVRAHRYSRSPASSKTSRSSAMHRSTARLGIPSSFATELIVPPRPSASITR